ncbi:unnamed protein product [Calypogeia fissa]
MAPHTLEMTVMAAEDLKDVATFGKMDVYAVVWVDPFSKRTTRILRKGGKNPVWNEWITVSLDSVRNCPNAYLSVQIFSEASMGDKVVGTGRLPVHEIYRINPPDGDEPALVTLQLQRPSGRVQGIISLSMRVTGAYFQPALPSAPPASAQWSNNLDDKNDDQEPVVGIPVPSYSGSPFYTPGVGTTSTGYPSLTGIEARDGGSGSAMVPYAYPPTTQYQGYPNYYPPQGAMTYPPPGPYTYVQPPRPQNRGNGSFLLGLLGGAIGGLLLGDIIS